MPPIPFSKQQLHLYVITDRAQVGARSLPEAVEAAVAGGATLIQYRDKHASRKAMYACALRLRDVTRALGVPFVVNDAVDLALAVEADGVHLGREDMPLRAARSFAGHRLWYGLSTHGAADAVAAWDEGPAYLAIGPLFPTSTKTDTQPVVGIEGVRAVRAAVPDAPLVGIGGITPVTAPQVRDAGADGVCAISAVWAGADIRAACRTLV